MDNVYSIRKDRNLYFILPKDCCIENYDNKFHTKSVAIFVHLFYFEDLNFYLKYLNNLPPFISIYIISPKDEILKHANKIGFKTIKKDNRGRDVSALLVSARDIINKYEYICFLHDKKTPQISDRNLVYKWVKSAWDNLLSSKYYIYNIFDIFERNPDIGLLVPPEPFFDTWPYYNSKLWGANYKGVRDLCENLGVKADINENIPPIAIGTFFWCKTKSLKKLFSYHWKYEDFPPEPMPSDNTISHYIERSLPYIAYDAGFFTGTIASSSYASNEYNMLRDFLQKAMFYFQDKHIAWTIADFDSFYQYFLDLRRYIFKYIPKDKYVYVYGTEKITENFIEKLKRFIFIAGILNNEIVENCKTFCNIPVYRINEIETTKYDDLIIIIAVNQKQESIVTNLLDKKNIKNYIMYYNIPI